MKPQTTPTGNSHPCTLGECATLACIWEATAAKPGNVYRGADFDDMTYADFLTSAVVIGPILGQVAKQGVGQTVLQAIQATRTAVATNTNLGMMLLTAPLAAVPAGQPLATGVAKVLSSLTVEDTQAVYQAIRIAQPSGLGEVPVADVRKPEIPQRSLVEAMRLAADHDLIALQYVNDFAQVFQAAEWMENGLRHGWPLSETIVYAFLQQLADFPDSLVVRKCGLELGEKIRRQAAKILGVGEPGDPAYLSAVQDFDFWLRADGHRRNPGTSADIIAAGLFVLLREQRLEWPVAFYGSVAGSSKSSKELIL